MIIFDGIIELLTVPELKGIVCHELGHWLHTHMNWRVFFSIFQHLSAAYLLFTFVRNKKRCKDFDVKQKLNEQVIDATGNFTYKKRWNIFALSEFAFVFGLFGTMMDVLAAFQSQAHELQSDSVSVQFGLGNELKDGLTKLYGTYKSVPIDPFVNWCFSSHPTLAERHRIIDETMALNPQLTPAPSTPAIASQDKKTARKKKAASKSKVSTSSSKMGKSTRKKLPKVSGKKFKKVVARKQH